MQRPETKKYEKTPVCISSENPVRIRVTLRLSIIFPGGLITSPGVGFVVLVLVFAVLGGGLVVINVVARHYVYYD